MSARPAADDDAGKPSGSTPTPEEIYAYFAGLSADDLTSLANDVVATLSAARDRPEAEAAVIKMSPFFLDCTYPRLSAVVQASLRDCLDAAEAKFGSLAAILGLEEELDGKEPPAPDIEQAIDLLLRHELPVEEQCRVARWVCRLPVAQFERLSPTDQVRLKQAVQRFEVRWGDLEKVANGEIPD